MIKRLAFFLRRSSLYALSRSHHSASRGQTEIPSGGELRVVFFGTDLFSCKIFDALTELLKQKKIKELCVVTSAARSEGLDLDEHKSGSRRASKIISVCASLDIKYHLWSSLSNRPDQFRILFDSFHVGVVASFGNLIPSELIRAFPFGIINIHPSLLPKWRGASPIPFSIMFNDKQVGVSLMKILPKQ